MRKEIATRGYRAIANSRSGRNGQIAQLVVREAPRNARARSREKRAEAVLAVPLKNRQIAKISRAQRRAQHRAQH